MCLGVKSKEMSEIIMLFMISKTLKCTNATGDFQKALLLMRMSNKITY